MKRTSRVRALSSRNSVSSPDKVEDRVKVKNKVKNRAKVKAKAMSNGVATPEVNSRMKVKTKKENRRNVNSDSSQGSLGAVFLKPTIDTAYFFALPVAELS